VRQILESTWQYQDERTGRLPHILRAGEPLMYYSSDGTLWALHRLLQYTAQSADTGLLQAKMPMVERFSPRVWALCSAACFLGRHHRPRLSVGDLRIPHSRRATGFRWRSSCSG
jgi:hypothetical protein